MKKALFIVALFSVRLQAHDVIWTENPFGIPGDLPFATPLSIYYKVGDARAAVFPPSRQFRVAPTRGEPCVVEVQLDKPESQFLAFENPTPAPDKEVTVIVRLTAIPLSTNKIEAEVTGRWRAVLGQDPKVCDATNWNEFVVPADIVTAPPWKVWVDSALGTFNIDTGGLNVGLRDSCFPTEPLKVIAYGNKFSFDWRMRSGSQLYSGIVERLANVSGSATDEAGNVLKGWQFGLSEGGLSTTINQQGTFELDALPAGINHIRGWTMLPYTDSTSGKPGSQYVGVILPIPSTERYETFDLKLNAQVFPSANTPYVPWLTIGYGKFNGSQTSLYYSGGVGAPEGTSRRDSGLQLWLISPNGMGTTIPVGPRDENVKENPEPGLWTIKGQLPNQPAFNLGVNYKF